MRQNILPQSRLDDWPPPLRARIVLQELGLTPAETDDLPRARALAAQLIGPDIASADSLAAVHRRSGGVAVFVFREEVGVTGVMAWAPLSRLGFGALVGERFNGLDPDPLHIAAADEHPAAAYGWGMAGATSDARRAVVAGSIALYERILTDVPWFSRAATPDGRRVILGKFGFSPAPASTNGLLVRWPLPQERAA